MGIIKHVAFICKVVAFFHQPGWDVEERSMAEKVSETAGVNHKWRSFSVVYVVGFFSK